MCSLALQLEMRGKGAFDLGQGISVGIDARARLEIQLGELRPV
jgi:hypothetical protein